MNNEEKQDLIKYRIAKAKDTLSEIELHFQNKLWNTAVNRLYYACFYAVSALLISKGILSKTHAGTKQMFGLYFVKPGLISSDSGDYYTIIFDLRHTGDYDDFIVFERDEVVALLQPAKELIAEIEAVLLNHQI